MYQWSWGVLSPYLPVFAAGALVTLELTFLVVCAGTLFGVLLAFLKRSDNVVLSLLIRGYIQLFRALPTLVLMIWIFYVTPIFTGWYMPPLVAATITLSLHLAAFVAETVRAGFESIPKGQYESGLALGMSGMQVVMRIMTPQAVRNILPNLIGLYITELKNSSLASVIAVGELLHRSNIIISETFRPLEVYTAVAVVYLAMILPLIYLGSLVERHFAKGTRHNKNILHEAGY